MVIKGRKRVFKGADGRGSNSKPLKCFVSKLKHRQAKDHPRISGWATSSVQQWPPCVFTDTSTCPVCPACQSPACKSPACPCLPAQPACPSSCRAAHHLLPPDLEALNAENYDFINGQRAKSTVQKTRRDATRFLDYLEALGVGRNL